MKRRRRNKLEVYIESFLMTVGFAVTLADFPSDVKKFELPAVYAEDGLVTLDASGEGVDIEVVFGEDGIKELVKEEVDAKMDEYQTQVVGVITPVETNTNNYDESSKILDEQLDAIVEEKVNNEISNNNNYSGMKLSHEYEDYLKGLCLKYSEQFELDYNTLYKIVMTIGYRESSGEWNNNGVYSKTNDLGEFQVNTCNLKDAKEVFGYTQNDLQYDRYKNANYAIYHMCTTIKHPKCKSIEDVFGMYNGWTKWRQVPASVNYARGCMEIMNDYFSEYQNSKLK